jgi:hypothetical protein
LIFLRHAFEEGLIDSPYRRGRSAGSEGLGRKWTVEFRDEGKTAVVGNNASYARFVQGQSDQALYHQTTGWTTDKKVAKQEARAVYEILARHIRIGINHADTQTQPHDAPAREPGNRLGAGDP